MVDDAQKLHIPAAGKQDIHLAKTDAVLLPLIGRGICGTEGRDTTQFTIYTRHVTCPDCLDIIHARV